jgi:hypothetical protein
MDLFRQTSNALAASTGVSHFIPVSTTRVRAESERRGRMFSDDRRKRNSSAGWEQKGIDRQIRESFCDKHDQRETTTTTSSIITIPLSIYVPYHHPLRSYTIRESLSDVLFNLDHQVQHAHSQQRLDRHARRLTGHDARYGSIPFTRYHRQGMLDHPDNQTTIPPRSRRAPIMPPSGSESVPVGGHGHPVVGQAEQGRDRREGDGDGRGGKSETGRRGSQRWWRSFREVWGYVDKITGVRVGPVGGQPAIIFFPFAALDPCVFT